MQFPKSQPLTMVGLSICAMFAGCATVRSVPLRDSEPAKGSTVSTAFQSPDELNRSPAEGPAGKPLTDETEPPMLEFGHRQFDDGINYEIPALSPLPAVENSDVTFLDMLEMQWSAVQSDHAEYYSAENMTLLVAALSAGALMANTGFDEHFLRDTYVDNVILARNDELYEKLHQPTFLGDGWYTIPVFAVAALSEPLIDELPLGQPIARWGQRSLRTIVVGAPPMLALQVLTGGSRPGETSTESRWKPFRDTNGVSGHSFMGAIPFLSAAKMTDNIWLKGGLYFASALPALSRVNDDKHYFSQAFLGWSLACLAADAVDRTEISRAGFQVYPLLNADFAGLGWEKSY